MQGGLKTLAVTAQAQQLLRIGGVIGQRMGLFVVAVVQRLMDAVFAPVIDQAVAGNLVEPGTKSRPTLWLTAAADQAQPGFLIDLLGKFRPAAQPQQKPVQALTVARVQNLERRAVALAITGQQRFVAAGLGAACGRKQLADEPLQSAHYSIRRSVAVGFDAVVVRRLCASSTNCTNSLRRPKRSSPRAPWASASVSLRLNSPV
ncbi:hypothetical protein D3C84_591530 [compost metagenome]